MRPFLDSDFRSPFKKIKFSEVDRTAVATYNTHVSRCGAIAQLGERLNGIQEVRGSNPLSSTIRMIKQLMEYSISCFFMFCLNNMILE